MTAVDNIKEENESTNSIQDSKDGENDERLSRIMKLLNAKVKNTRTSRFDLKRVQALLQDKVHVILLVVEGQILVSCESPSL